MRATRSGRSVPRQLVGSCVLSALLLAQTAAAFTVAQNPPFLPTPMPPNIVLTLDDSSSMARAFVPESLDSASSSRRAKSSHRNALYYNPTTVYPRPVFVNADGTTTTLTASFTDARINGFADSGPGRASSLGTVNLSNGYRPTWEYDPSRTFSSQTFANHPNADLTRIGVTLASSPGKAYYYVWSPTNSGCTSTNIDDDACYSIRIVGEQAGPADVDGNGVVNGDDERLNFAIWYSFYRTRNLMTVAAASRAMADVPSTARVGFQALRASSSGASANGLCALPSNQNDLSQFSCSGWTQPNPAVDNRIREFSSAHKNGFYRWLFMLPAPTSNPFNFTPLRSAVSRIGRYFTTSGVNSPYAQQPQVSVGTEFSCRPNFHIVMTDGYWNSDQDTTSNFCSGTNCGNVDNTSRDLPDGKRYDTTLSLTSIYRSSTDQNSGANNLADIAFHYWATDLRSDLANNLLPFRSDRSGNADQQYWNPKNDPATWQHLVTFTVGLGLTSTLNLTTPDRRWGGSTYAGAGYANFLSGAASWPATGTSSNWSENNTTSSLAQGRVYDLWHAAINSRGQAFSAETPRELADALRTALNRILERESASAALATNSSRLATDTLLFQARFSSGTWTGSLTAYAINADGSVGNVQWEATAPGNIPAHGARNIFTWSGTAGTTFDQAGLTAAGLWSSIGSTGLLNYLRGDSSQEEKNGGNYRTRGGPLGDIINSDPVFVFAENYGYRSLPEGATTYQPFVASKQSRRKMLYVGSNDGFLRAFDALTGQERFAFVPQAVIPDLPQLADPNYGHRYYVDGAPVAWDAYFGNAWRTVLIGSTGAGGRSVFALDVTDPDAFSASKVLWEINQNTPYRTGASGDAADPQYGARLGLTIGQAVVAKLNNGEWVAIFGNGYRSPGNASASPAIPGDQASLYIVRLSDGRLIKRIDTGVGSITAPNGLGTPTLHDLNGDDVYDVVYAPDMRGNVWKFDLTSTSPGSWGIAFASASGFPNGAPLFQARSGSGAVQPISARVELTAPPPGKSGIMVVFGTGRFFAVGDNTDTTGQTFYGIWDDGTRVTATDRSTLQAQTISTSTINLRGVNTLVRSVSANAVDWATKRGWYIDLPTSMERVTGSAVVRGGRVIFTTLIPSVDPCEFGGSGWLMEVDAATGTKLPYSVFDTSGDKYVNSADADISGVPVGVGMVRMPLVLEGTPTAFKFLSGTKGEIQLERNRTFGPPLGRESWREVQR